MPLDFDTLAVEAYGPDGDTASRNELWSQTFLLPEWLFIARGPNLDQPYICMNASVADNKPMIKAFTDGLKLNRFGRDNGLADDKGVVLSLSLKINDGLLQYLTGFESEGIFGIHFNADVMSNGFFAPLSQLSAVLDHLRTNVWNAPS